MADELNKSAEFAGKHQDEENPILVAQRYLNIYRQIHIFNQKRRDEFDDSLLKMPSDIRVLLSTLPGGSLLLEHIADLEEKRGLIPSELLDSKSEKNGTSDAKTSLAAKSSAKNTDTVALSNNLIKILQQNEEKHAKDLQALTDAFLKSQENMTAILSQALNVKAPKRPMHQVSSLQHAQEKPQPKQEYIPQAESQEELKSIPEEAPIAETASKILNFTKKLFTSSKEETGQDGNADMSTQFSQPDVQTIPQTQVVMPAVDHTPVSLDDIDAAPVSLDSADAESFSSELAALQNNTKVSNTTNQSGNDWEWGYVDDSGSADDEEWEYIADEAEDPQGGQWEYTEDPNAEYTYEYTDPNTGDNWEYSEENYDNATGQEGVYPSSSQPQN